MATQEAFPSGLLWCGNRQSRPGADNQAVASLLQGERFRKMVGTGDFNMLVLRLRLVRDALHAQTGFVSKRR